MSGAGHTNGPGPPLNNQSGYAQQTTAQMQQTGLSGAAASAAQRNATADFGQTGPAGAAHSVSGQKHGLSSQSAAGSPSDAASSAVESAKRQRLFDVQTGAPAGYVPGSDAADATTAAAASASGGSAVAPNGGKMQRALMSPGPASPSSSVADAYGSWSLPAASSLSSSAPTTSEQALAVAQSHLAKLAAWRANAQAEIELLQKMLQPDNTEKSFYADFTKPYTTSFAVLDQATPIPPFSAIAASAAAAAAAASNSFGGSASGSSRLARAAHSAAQHSAIHASLASAADGSSAGGASVGPNLEELEAKRAELALQIKLFSADSGRKLDKSLEPPRNKTHWDYLLAEMEWMAGDFVRERKWKGVLAKKIGKSVLQHHKREVDKEFRALKDEVIQRRKRAAWVSREIKKFWSNIGKLVKHKHNALVEEEKKKAMGEHLETLVHQTESFSSKLAQDLTSKGVAGAQKAQQLAAAQAALASAAASASPPASSAAASSTSAAAAAAAAPSPSPSAAASASAAEEESSNTDDIEVGRVDDILQSLKGPPTADARRSTRVHKPIAVPAAAAVAAAAAGAAGTAGAEDANDGEFAGESSEDDEGTLSEEEEKDAAADAGKSKADAAKAEVSQLEAEAEMSIEELRKLYAARDDEEEEEEEGGEEEAEGDEEEGATDAGASQSEAASVAPSTSASPAAASGDDNAAEGGEEGDEDAEMDSDDDADGPDEGAAAELPESNTTLLLQTKNATNEEQRMTIASNLAQAAQPAGYTLADVKVKTKVPHLMRGPGPLREYQHIGLDWMVSMYENGLNGILADEMGLGKTVMTIALLAHLAVEKGIWGEHLIVVPTSVIINWEMEFKRWCPAFKILAYHGSAKERKAKRKGWSDPNLFHACITSYQLVLQDAKIFKRKKWHYLILDEAHNIKNFKSARWQTLLHFRTARRLLLTGTPMQNSTMEIWALMHFLMPNIFQSQAEFKEWFSNPVTAMVEGKDGMNQKLLARLHGILRPFLLRRLKSAVAQQLPAKYEHVLTCKMSKRQRVLYEDFMANSDTQRTLASGNFMGMMNVVMSLRKVCNHPDLFSGRAIVSPFDQFDPIKLSVPSMVCNLLPTAEDERPRIKGLDLDAWGLLLQAHQARQTTKWESERVSLWATPREDILAGHKDLSEDPFDDSKYPIDPLALPLINQLRAQKLQWKVSRRAHVAARNAMRTRALDFALYPANLLRTLTIGPLARDVHALAADPRRGPVSRALSALVTTYAQRADLMQTNIEKVCCIIPKARARPPKLVVLRPSRARLAEAEARQARLFALLSPATDIYRTAYARLQLFFPDKYLLQWDCGKLQRLAQLLQERKAGGHRVLIFSQFSKMLDILESFLSMHGYKYLRLDGSTKVDDRGRLMEKFNRDNKIFCFILSTRSGGIGINLTGADSCVMYDSDWNPAMDLQAQDRAHRLGQVREVNVYRLITERSIEENILRKSNQKREMNNVVIGDGNFNTDFLEKLDPRELLGLGKIESKVQIEEMKDEEQEAASSAATAASKAQSAASLAAAIEKQRVEMASLEDEADRIALAQSLAESQVDQDDFNAGDVGEKSKARAAAAHPASAAAYTAPPAASAIRSLGKVGAMRGKASTSSSAAVAAFENALTPVQRYALYFAEHVDPVITAQQMRATQKQMQTEESKWQAKQGKVALPGAASLTVPAGSTPNPSSSPSAFPAGDAMDTSDAPSGVSVKIEGGVRVKQEPVDPSSSVAAASSSSAAAAGASSSGHAPSASSLPPSSPSKNVSAGNRLEDNYLYEQLLHSNTQLKQFIRPEQDATHSSSSSHAHNNNTQQQQQQLHSSSSSSRSASGSAEDLRLTYDFPFQQLEYGYAFRQAEALEQNRAQLAASSAGGPAPVPNPHASLPSPMHFASFALEKVISFPHFDSHARHLWLSKQYKASMLQLMKEKEFAGVRPVPQIKDAVREPNDADIVLLGDQQAESEESKSGYGLFSSPDSISRMLGPKLVHPERVKARAAASGASSVLPASKPSSAPTRRRVAGEFGSVRLSFASVDNSDPVSVRIPWLRLRSGGLDRSSLVLSRAGVDYPAKTNTTKQQQQAAAATNQHQHNQSTADEANKFRSNIAYFGLNMDGIAPFHPGLQNRAVTPTTMVMPPKKMPLAAGSAPKPAPGGDSSARRKREGFFSRPNRAPRAPALDDSMLKEVRIWNWTTDEDHALHVFVLEYGMNWPLIAQLMSAQPRFAGRLRSAREVCARYAYIAHKKAGGAEPAYNEKGLPVSMSQKSSSGAIVGAAAASGGAAIDPSKPPGSDAMDTSGASGAPDDGKKKKGKKDKAGNKVDPAAVAAAAAAAAAAKKASKNAAVTAPGVPSALPSSAGFGTRSIVRFMDAAARQVKNDQAHLRVGLRAQFNLPPVDDPLQKPPNFNVHQSHKAVVLDAHQRLGLPSAAIGKTLMPHQIIQLRSRKPPRVMMDDRGRPIPMTREQEAALQQQQQQQRHQQQQMQGGQHPMGPGVGPGGPPMNMSQPGGGGQSRSNYPVQGGGGGPNGPMGPGPPPNQRMSSQPVPTHGGGGGGGSSRGGAPMYQQGGGGPMQQPSSSRGGPQQPGSQPYPNQSGGGQQRQSSTGSNYSSGGGNAPYPLDAQGYPQQQQGGYNNAASNPSQLQRYQTAPSSSSGAPRGGPPPQQQQQGSGNYSNAPGGSYPNAGNAPSSQQQNRAPSNYSSNSGGGYPAAQGQGGSYSNNPSPPPPSGPSGGHSSRAKSPAGSMQAGGAGGAYYPPPNANSGGGSSGAYYPPPNAPNPQHFPSSSRGTSGNSGGGGGYTQPAAAAGGNAAPSAADVESHDQLKQILQWVQRDASMSAISRAVFEVAQRPNISTQHKLAEITHIVKKHQGDTQHNRG